MSIAETLLYVPKFIVNSLSETFLEREPSLDGRAITKEQAQEQERNRDENFLKLYGWYSEENLNLLNGLEKDSKELLKKFARRFKLAPELVQWLLDSLFYEKNSVYEYLDTLIKELPVKSSRYTYHILKPIDKTTLFNWFNMVNNKGIESNLRVWYPDVDWSAMEVYTEETSKIIKIISYCVLRRDELEKTSDELKKVHENYLPLIAPVISTLPDKNIETFLNTGENIDKVARALLDLRGSFVPYNQKNIDAVIAAGVDAERNTQVAIAYYKQPNKGAWIFAALSFGVMLIAANVIGLGMLAASAMACVAGTFAYGISLKTFQNHIKNIVSLLINPPAEENNSVTAQLGEKSVQYSPLGYAAYFASYLNPRAYVTNEHNEGVAQGLSKKLKV